MGLEFSETPRLWVGREAGWEPVEGVAHVQLEETLSAEEQEELTWSFQDFVDRLLATAYAQAARRCQETLDQFFDGFATWEPRGLSAWITGPRQPTPIERALQILAPHLAHEPLYQPKQRWFRADPAPLHTDGQPDKTGEIAPSTDRPAWQSPYGPAPRRR
jgi:hypothetical protein